ncbi:MAG: phage portal protein [Opitutaceae bacterium]|nr:phage portal protein [Opitutaceae bacterium]
MSGFKVQSFPVESGVYRKDQLKAVLGAADWLRGEEGSSSADRISGSAAAYALVPLIYRAVKLRADAISSVPVHVWKGEQEVAWPFDTDSTELIWQTEAALLLNGFALWLKKPNARRPRDLQWVNPNTVGISYTPGRGLIFKQEGTTDNTSPWTEDQVVYFREFHPTDDVGAGVGAADVAIEDARLLRYLTRFAGRYFENGAMPVTLLGFEYAPSQEESERVEKWFQKMATGIRNAWKVLALRGKVTPTILTPPPKELEMKELNNQARHNVAMAFGIPQTMLEDAANYATAGEHRMSFWQDTVRPRGRIYESAINSQLFKPMGLRLQLDFEEMGIFQVDEAERSNALYNLTLAGYDPITASEVLGYQLNQVQVERILANRPVAEANVTEVNDPDESGAAGEDLKRWERKAARRVKEGRRPNVSFESKAISAGLHAAIEGALEECASVNDVRLAFAGAAGWEAYP